MTEPHRLRTAEELAAPKVTTRWNRSVCLELNRPEDVDALIELIAPAATFWDVVDDLEECRDVIWPPRDGAA